MPVVVAWKNPVGQGTQVVSAPPDGACKT